MNPQNPGDARGTTREGAIGARRQELAPDLAPEAAKIAEDVIAAVANHLPVRSVLLIGSAARGEETYVTRGGHRELVSDLEFLVLTRGRVDAGQTSRLNRAIRGIEDSAGYSNPYFHITLSVEPALRFRVKAPRDRRIATYELLRNGRLLMGEQLDRKPLLFGVDRLDLGSTNELLLTRLWLQLLNVRREGLTDSDEAEDRLWMKYSLCRNLLEILTVFLPNEGVLLPSYRSRFAAFEQKYPGGSVFGADAVEVQRAALEGKLLLHLDRPLEWYQEKLLRQYLALTAYLIGRRTPLAPDLEPELGRIEQALQLVGDRPFRSHRVNEVRRGIRDIRFLKYYRRDFGGFPSALRWLRTPQRPSMLRFLFWQHLALLQLVRGEEPHALKRSAPLLESFHPAFSGDQLSPTDPVAAWWMSRNEFCRYMQVWKGVRDKRSFDIDE